MTHLSPPAPEDSTVTRKTSKLSADPASEVMTEANWYTHSQRCAVAPDTNLRASVSPWRALGIQGYTLPLSESMWQEIHGAPAAAHRQLTGVAWTIGHWVSITEEASLAFLLGPQEEAGAGTWQAAKEPWRPQAQVQESNHPF